MAELMPRILDDTDGVLKDRGVLRMPDPTPDPVPDPDPED